jgi:iron complex outermembrane recepter protein
MFKKSKVCSGVLLALGGALLVGVSPTIAQNVERIEITGSSIKRVAAEGALPVLVLRREDIEKTGVTTARDLIQLLPSMQGFTTSSQSVNGGGGGTTTANLRNLGAAYTLVLLNGRRMAPFNTGSTVNLEQLPLAAVDRIEVLLDGASALYGSDAIGGVVNFITKKNSVAGEVDLRFSSPQRSGGRGIDASISKGFGDIEANGFNILGALSYSKQDVILAKEREWTKSGIIPFVDTTGRSLYLFQTSINANPPNVTVQRSAANGGAVSFAPTLITGGDCGANSGSVVLGNNCRFDFANTVDLIPETELKSAFLSGEVKLPAKLRAFGEFLYSDASVKAGFAPPAQALGLAKTSPLYSKYVLPALTKLGINPTQVTTASVNLRLSDAGQRKDDFQNQATQLVFGVEGEFGDWTANTTFLASRTVNKQINLSGYSSRLGLDALIDSGKYDYFAQGTDASRAALAPAVLTGFLADKSTSDLAIATVNANGPVFKIEDRDVMLGLGAEYRSQKYKDEPAPIYQGPNILQPDYADFPVGSGQGSLPFQAKRTNYGLYSELLVPVIKGLDLTLSGRYDSYSDVDNSFNFDATGALLSPAKQGNKASSSTYKLALRFQPIKEVLLRASAGTGFRAPTLANIVAPLSEAGVTGVSRACPVAAGDPLFAGCAGRPPSQWKVQSGGNPFTGSGGLKPEKSDQWSVGFIFEPAENFSAGLDLWEVEIRDAITTVNEATAFAQFERYRGLFSVTTETATGLPVLTLNQVPVNAAARVSRGIDWDWTLRNKFAFGKLTTRFTGTYFIKQYVDFGLGGGAQSSLNQFGPENQVVSRVLTRLSSSLETGDFTNTLTWSYRPGYTDQAYTAASGTIALRNADGSRGAFIDFQGFQVPSTNLFDWQGKYKATKDLGLTIGVRNLFDRAPPLSIKTNGGNQVGADPRYADSIGRSYYLQANYKF